jgi:hypothetical protein
MQLYVPEIGDHIVLTDDWTFKLYPERRNTSISDQLGLKLFSGWKRNYRHAILGWYDESQEEMAPQYNNYRGDNEGYYKDYDNWLDKIEKLIIPELIINFPVGTILKVDRIYIRKGNKEYSSITFHAKNIEIENGYCKISQKKKVKAFRFWAKLSECNNIQFDITEEA